MPTPITREQAGEIKSAHGHVAHFEAYVAARKAEIEAGGYMVDEATTRRWLAWGEAELADWRRKLAAAEKGPPPPLG